MGYRRTSGRLHEVIFVPYNGKIADINEADTNKHTLDLETALGETRKIIAVIIGNLRVSGTGYLYAYPNEGTDWVDVDVYRAAIPIVVIKDGTQRLQYNQTVANDDFDLNCFGYMVEA